MSVVDNAITPFGVTNEDAKIAELAALSVFDYEKCREDEAKSLGVRVSVLDKEVVAARQKELDSDVLDHTLGDVEPWPEPVDGAALLSDIRAVILRFCVLPDYSDILIAAWVLHAWAHDAAEISPILAFVSPEKRCGKTTALLVVGVLVPKAMHNINISTSVLFRVIEIYSPTVLIDEADTYLNDNDEMRGIINGGHNRLNCLVWRSVGDDFKPKPFNVWAPKCIAMIGKLPDTLEDRALVVPLRRKQAGKVVERFRANKLAEFLPLRRKAQRWADDNLMHLREMDPDVPEALNDRAQEMRGRYVQSRMWRVVCGRRLYGRHSSGLLPKLTMTRKAPVCCYSAIFLKYWKRGKAIPLAARIYVKHFVHLKMPRGQNGGAEFQSAHAV